MVWTQAGEIITLLRKQLGLDGEVFVIEKIFKKEIGINEIEITGYKNGIIFSKTTSSVVICELTIRKNEILRKLNQYFGNQKIKNIKITITD
jgi:hypothetical protein